MTMIVDPTTTDFEEILTQLNTYVQTKQNYNVYKDFYEGGAGTITQELRAAIATFFQYVVISNRRETYLYHALNKSSKVAIAETLGYSCYRGKNLKIKLRVASTATMTLSNFMVVGTYGDLDVIYLGYMENGEEVYEDTVLQSGNSYDIIVTLGVVKEESVNITSTDSGIFRFVSENVSEDFELLLNGTKLVTSVSVFDLLNEKFVTLTNPMGAVDVLYLNRPTFAKRYIVGDVLTLKYIETSSVVFELSSIRFDYGTIVAEQSALLAVAELSEAKSAITVNAPLYHETQGVIRGREDFRKVVKLLIPNAVDTNSTDVSPAVVNISYVKDDMTLLTQGQKDAILAQLERYRPMGVWYPQITNPVKIELPLNIQIFVTNLTGLVMSNLINGIHIILQNYEKILGLELTYIEVEETYYLTQIEKEIEDLANVQVARVATESVLPVLSWNEYFKFIYGVKPSISVTVL